MKDALFLYNTTVSKIPIETKDSVFTVSSADIIAVEALYRKVIVYTNSARYESKHPISYWTHLLQDKCFIQTHRSYIINMMHVSQFNHTLIYLHNNQITAYLTKRKYTEFKNAYLLYIESLR